MSADRVRFHEGARADVKNAVVWYQRHSARAAADFVEEIYRATETIKAAPERWPEEKYGARRFYSGAFLFRLSIQSTIR